MNKKRLIELLSTYAVSDLSSLELSKVRKEELIFFLRDNKISIDENFFIDLAKGLELPFVDREYLKRKSYLAPALPYTIIKENLIFLLEISSDRAYIATSNPFNKKIFKKIEEILNVQVKLSVASIRAIEEANETGYIEYHKYKALNELYVRNPDKSARIVFSPMQKYLSGIFLFATLIIFILNFHAALLLIYCSINLIYFIINPIKFYIFYNGLLDCQRTVSPPNNALKKLKENDLPFYTVLIPLYKEAKILPRIMENIYNMDYPKNKLDVKILLEENDDETISEARSLGLLGYTQEVKGQVNKEEYRNFLKLFDLILVPDDIIKTKPRACNYGLLRAIGDYCVIYDAEDRPDPDQLKKAIIAFSHTKDDYACFQARLNYYNSEDNFLTKWFTIEYTCWFNYYLQGLEHIGCPIPLGGTSNHFKTGELRKLYGWDPYNVTEDADLGIRIARKRLKTAMLDSYTLEEANNEIINWIRQRSRWNKGYVQTFLVHMRHPRRTKNELGWNGFLLFILNFGGNIFIPLINPFLWVLTLLTLLHLDILHQCSFYPLVFIGMFNLTIGNLVYISLHLFSCLKEKKYALIPYAVTIPIYWILVSVGAWKGLLQLITKPFYWEKTVHGIYKEDIK